jgi:TonB family protein
VVTARVVEGSGRQELDSAAVNVARMAKFGPEKTGREITYAVVFPGAPPR